MPELAPPRRRLPWILAAGTMAAVHAADFGLARPPITTDIRFFLNFARWMSEGAVPHVDFFDPKTQLASALGAGLVRLGAALQLDPLTAIRAGWLALTVALALGLGRLQRKLASGDPLQALLGVAGWCAFPMLVLLPAIGNVPKLLMALSATLAALAVGARRWGIAGGLGGLAVLDWQIGLLVPGATLVSALVHGRPRKRAVAAVLVGTALPLAAAGAYHLARGSLGAALEETVATPFLRASDPANQEPFSARLSDMRRHLERSAPGSTPIAVAGGLGVLACAVAAIRSRRKLVGAELSMLALYHGGVLGFTAIDYQGRGDLMLLAASLAFGLGFGLAQVHARLAVRLARGGRALAAAEALLLVVALAVGRPGPTSAAALAKRPPLPTRGVTLEAQREVAGQLERMALGRRLALSDHSELLFLADLHDVLPTIYWGEAAWTHFRDSPDESSLETLGRLLEESDADLYVISDAHADALGFADRHDEVELSSADGQYRVRVYLRRPAPPTSAP